MPPVERDRRRRVLIVEDDGGVARMLRSSLEQAGLDTTEIASGSEALEILEQQSPDAVILDLQLADGRGNRPRPASAARRGGNRFPRLGRHICVGSSGSYRAMRLCGRPIPIEALQPLAPCRDARGTPAGKGGDERSVSRSQVRERLMSRTNITKARSRTR